MSEVEDTRGQSTTNERRRPRQLYWKTRFASLTLKIRDCWIVASFEYNEKSMRVSETEYNEYGA